MSQELKESRSVITEATEKPVFVDRETVEKMIESAKNDMVKESKLEIDKQIQNTQTSFVTIFGIFASILSFLTIEFRFLKDLSNINQIIGFTLVLWSLLFSFNLALDYLAVSRINQKKVKLNKHFSIVVWMLFSIGIAFIVFDKNFWWMQKIFRGLYHLRNSNCSS